MREVPGDGAEAECTLKRAKEVSCASGEEGPDEEGRNQGKELGERVWQRWELVSCVRKVRKQSALSLEA